MKSTTNTTPTTGHPLDAIRYTVHAHRTSRHVIGGRQWVCCSQHATLAAALEAAARLQADGEHADVRALPGRERASSDEIEALRRWLTGERVDAIAARQRSVELRAEREQRAEDARAEYGLDEYGNQARVSS